MKLLYAGKTKDVFSTDNDNLVLLRFKDELTGVDGVFDPGANTVGLTVEGAGKSGLRMTTYFYELLNRQGVPTHFVSSDVDNASMTVKKATVFGKGLEVICRYRAVGSFLKRFGAYCHEGDELGGYVEVTIKDDERGDPFIPEDALVLLDILDHDEYAEIKAMTLQICSAVRIELSKKNLELYDIKLEFGRDADGGIMLIDEISGGNMRVYKEGKYLEPLQLESEFLN